MTDHDAATSAPMTGAEFRVLRDWLGMTGDEIAQRLGIAQRTVRRWENAAHLPPATVRGELWALVAEADGLAAELVAAAGAADGVVLIPVDGDDRGTAGWWRMVAARCLATDPALRVEYQMRSAS